jgi:hypothetical protein
MRNENLNKIKIGNWSGMSRIKILERGYDRYVG